MDDVELDYTFHELCIIILPLLIDVLFGIVSLFHFASIAFGALVSFVVSVVLIKLIGILSKH